MLDTLREDTRHGVRQAERAPILTAVATVVLALGIGTNAAVFAVIDGVLFRPPPGVEDAAALVEIRSVPAGTSRLFNGRLTYAEFLALREDPSLAGEVAARTTSWSANRGLALRTSQGDESVSAELVTSAYFRVLRTPMALGAGFRPGDDRPGATALQVVLGHAFWMQRTGGSADAIGSRLTLNGYPFTIVGVAAEGFHGAAGQEDPFDVWLPVTASGLLFADDAERLEEGRRFAVIARLAPGASLARANAAAEAAGLRAPPAPGADPDERRRLSVSPYRGLGAADAGEIMAFVGGAGGLIGGIILLIACVNVSALLLGRSLARRREIAVRLALGATRARIVRQLLTESVTLGLVAGGLGILLATWALDALGAALFTFPVRLSPRFGTLAATVGVAAGTGIVFGTFPALHATRAAVFTVLKDAVAGTDPRTSRMRGWFAAAQLALSLPLLTAAGLLVSGVIRSVGADSVIREPDRLIAISLDLRSGGYDAARVDALLTEGRTRVAALPGVGRVAFARSDPVSGSFTGRIRLPAEAAATSFQPLEFALLNAVDPEYFETVGLTVSRGRAIDRTDVPGGTPTVVIGADAAQRLWPGRDPLGRTLTYVQGADRESQLTIVGVSPGTGLEWDGSDGSIVLYGSRRQFPDTLGTTLLVRTLGDAGPVIARVRTTLNALDPQLVVARTSVMADRLRESRAELTHATAGAAGVGLLALLLACIGVYAVVAFGVAERTREIGVRVALGASRAAVVQLFVRGGLRLAVLSLAIGLPLTFAVVRFLGAGMFGVARFTALHAAALLAIVLLLISVAALSSWIPARRSAAVDPVVALRVE
jgi:predicted permease